MRRPDSVQLFRAGKWLFSAVVPLSAMLLGALPTSALCGVATLAAIAVVLLYRAPAPEGTRVGIWVPLGAAILLAATALSIVPLPAGLVSALAPTNAEIWSGALSAFREAGPSVHSISVAPVATRVELLRGLFYVCLFFGAIRILAEEDGRAHLERVVVGSGVAMALVALGHAAVSAETVFGVYRPREVYAYLPGRFGPLLNTNHLAAYLDVAACVAAGAVLSRHPSMPHALGGGAALLCGATSVWAASRGGMGGLVLGVSLAIGLGLFVRRSSRRDGKRLEGTRRVELLVGGVALLAAAVMLGLGASDFARGEVANLGDFSKLQLAKRALKLVTQSPVFGFGRGAFETVFPLVRNDEQYLTSTHPENIVAQWSTEWGVPIAIAGAACFAFALRPHALLRTSRPAVGAWAAIVATVVHELVDYHLETPGVMALVVVCLALAVRPGHQPDAGERLLSGAFLRKATFAASALAVLVAAWLVPVRRNTLAEDRVRLSALATDRAVSREDFHREVRAAMLRYPGEAFLPLMGAVHAQLLGGESVVPWIGRALTDNPRFGRAHYVLARSLAQRSPAQARLEYRLAYEYDARLRAPIALEVARLVGDADDALELVPEGKGGPEMLELLAQALEARLPSSVVQLDAELLRRDPAALGPVERKVQAALSDVANRHPWCVDPGRGEAVSEGCLADALAAARALVERAPGKCRPHALLARLHAESGEVGRGIDELAEAAERVSDRATCMREAITLAIDKGDKKRASALLDRFVRAGCGTSLDCFGLYEWAGAMAERQGQNAKAVALYRRANEVAPSDAMLERIADLAARTGLVGDALEAYKTLASRNPTDERWPKHVAELRAKSDVHREFLGPGSDPRVLLEDGGARRLLVRPSSSR